MTKIKKQSSAKLIAISRDPLSSKTIRDRAKKELKLRKVKTLKSGSYSVVKLNSKSSLRVLRSRRLRGF